MPRLSVIMPAKNAQTTIRAAIGSTLRALPKDAEIVVWNDGSTDTTGDIASQFEGSRRVRVMHTPSSIGGGAARKVVMEQTDSEYVASMDADDLCLPWRFKLQFNHLKHVDVSFMTHIKFGMNVKDFRPTLPFAYEPAEVTSALLVHNPLTHPTMMGRRTSLEFVDGYSDMAVAQDYDLWMRLAAAGTAIGRLGLPGIAYRQNAQQVTRRPDFAEVLRSQTGMVTSYLNLLESIAPGTRYDLRQAESVSSRESIVSRVLLHQSRTMGPPLGAYYRHLLKRRLFGPMWGCWEWGA